MNLLIKVITTILIFIGALFLVILCGSIGAIITIFIMKLPCYDDIVLVIVVLTSAYITWIVQK